MGALFGQAAGDAMGMPSELWPQSRVRQHFGWIDRFLPGQEENISANEYIAGEFTDDTQQAITLAESLIEAHGRVDPELIAIKILEWAESVDAFEKNILGPTSKAALITVRAGIAVKNIPANGITNGAAMRISPLGCAFSTADLPAFINVVRQSCSPTHKSDIAVAGAFAIAWSVSQAIEGGSWQEIKQALPELTDRVQNELITTCSPSLGRRITRALSLAESLHALPDDQMLYELYQTLGAGMDSIESIPMALAIVECANTDPVRCAILSANLGGDTDTIGAMATAICGAIHGIDAFPADWIELISQVNTVNLPYYASSLLQLREKANA
ncbi:ADP-ribosylglycohydrolase family protein [Edaphovirga cremea]|uniref:ADP-ribosylglycohydrolase family protein n=1 Tax=Edaphovirga cremea TaxID=2267246 RepID=UPI000DEFD1C0|nr:ADP-ribosylglycohydrolase family protein [Edaphovirga cremea]